MDTSLLHPDIQKYINSQIGVDVAKLALQKNPRTFNGLIAGGLVSWVLRIPLSNQTGPVLRT
jgi:hypothetical protein